MELHILAFAAVVYGMWVFDRLIRWEYEHHREQWERDGKPVGIFWVIGSYAFGQAIKRIS